MSHGNGNRRKGEGRRDGDKQVRLSAQTLSLLQLLKHGGNWELRFGSADFVIRAALKLLCEREKVSTKAPAGVSTQSLER